MSDSGPHERLAESVSKYLGMRLPDSLPRKWEKFSDVVLLPSDAFTSRGWAEFRGHGLWRAVADGLGATPDHEALVPVDRALGAELRHEELEHVLVRDLDEVHVLGRECERA